MKKSVAVQGKLTATLLKDKDLVAEEFGHNDSMESKQKLGYYKPILAYVKENDPLDLGFLELINGLSIIFKQIPGYGPLTSDDMEWVLNQPDNKIAQTNICLFRGVVLAKSKDKNLQVKNHRYKSALVYFDIGDEIPNHISYAGEKEFNSVSVFQQAIALKQVK